MNCPHRGHKLVGNTCPYHGISFPPPCNTFVREEPSALTSDFAFVLDSMIQDFGSMFCVVEQLVQAPWYLWMQNTADFNHLRHVHPDFSQAFVGEPFDVRISPDNRRSSHRLLVNQDTVFRYQRLTRLSLNGSFLHYLEYPNLSATSFMDIFYSMERAEPQVDGGCFVTTSFYTSRRNPIPNSIVLAAIEGNKKILAEDKAIVESWAASGVRTGNWLPFEARIKAFCEVAKQEGVFA